MAASAQATKKSCISLFDCFILKDRVFLSFFIYVVYNITCNCFTKNKF